MAQSYYVGAETCLCGCGRKPEPGRNWARDEDGKSCYSMGAKLRYEKAQRAITEQTNPKLLGVRSSCARCGWESDPGFARKVAQAFRDHPCTAGPVPAPVKRQRRMNPNSFRTTTRV